VTILKKIASLGLDLLSALLALVTSLRLLRIKNRIVDRAFSRVVKRSLAAAGDGFFLMHPADILGEKYIRVGKNFSAFGRLRLEAYDRHLGHEYQPSIVIGDRVSINYDCHIGCVNKIVIGNDVLMASKIFITDHMHGEATAEALKTPPSARKVVSPGPVVIGDNVWIGEGVAIMPNVTIGRNAIIGANAVVTTSIPENAVAVGVPARVIRVLGQGGP
jgi:acetyltransferase-like isoleucine patch superfamily enzyme